MSAAQSIRVKMGENAMFIKTRKFATALTILSAIFAKRNLAMENPANMEEFAGPIKIRKLSSANAPLDFMANHAR